MDSAAKRANWQFQNEKAAKNRLNMMVGETKGDRSTF